MNYFIIAVIIIGIYVFFKIADMNRTPEEIKRKDIINKASKIKNCEDRKKFLSENLDWKEEGQKLYNDLTKKY